MDSIILICLSVNLSLKVVNKKQYAVLIPLLLHERNILASCSRIDMRLIHKCQSKGSLQKKKSKISDIVTNGRVGWGPKSYF